MLCLTGLVWTASLGQVGQTEWMLVDAERNDREVPCSVWYPEALDTTYPAVVFAHGFVMGPSDYQGLAQGLVEAGYVFVSLGTEQGFSPDHAAYGLDLAFVATQVATNSLGGVLAGFFNGRVAIAGHSMGGGAAWLAAEANPPVDAIIGLAPAETNPSAVAAGESIYTPTMVVSGTDDAVTPPATQHEPIYEAAVNSPCRAFVSIPDGGHCGYADPGTLCDFGELGFQGLSHAEQLALSVSVVVPWLDAFVRDDPSGLDALEQAAALSGLGLTLSCALKVETPVLETLEVFYQDPPSGLTLHNTTNHPVRATLWSVHGQQAAQRTLEPAVQWTPSVTKGLYVVTSGGAFARTVIVH